MAKHIDWASIENEYREGRKPLREIGLMYGVSEGGIRKNAKIYNWSRKSNLIFKKDDETKEGFVYLISILDSSGCKFYKIGMAKTVQHRIDAIKGCLPFEVTIECAYFTENMRLEESMLHNIFLEKNVRGEWFKLESIDVEFIASRSLVSGQKNG